MAITDDLIGQLIDQLIVLYRKKTYLTIDDILNTSDGINLPLDELDRVCEILLDKGILIHQELNEVDENDDQYDIFNDRSHIDYEEIYKRVVQIDSSLREYIAEIRKIPPPRANEERRLIIQAREGNSYARERILSMFLKVVVRMSLWYFDNYSLPLSDTIQNGNVGLVIAIEKMPLSPEYRFSSYAPWWIRQNIEKFAEVSGCFYVPIHLKDKLLRIIGIIHHHCCNQCNGIKKCPNLLKEIAEKLLVDESDITRYIKLIEEPLSIENALVDRDNQNGFSDCGEFANDLINSVIQEEIITGLPEILSGLRAKEIDVIMRRSGLGDYEPMTLEEIAKEYGVTRERIRQIEANAKSKLLKNKGSKQRYFNELLSM